MNKKEIGSMTAKGGFLNENDICTKFLNWKQDNEAQQWLMIMGYDYMKINYLKAIQIPPNISLKKAQELGISEEKYNESIKFKKADIQIVLEILIDGVLYKENLSLKKANKGAGYNQVDKRPVNTYQAIWGFNDNISKYLKLFTGEYNPIDYDTEIDYANLKDDKKRRVNFLEMPNEIVNEIIEFFKVNKMIVLCDILQGRGGLKADWFLVTEKSNNIVRWILKPINFVINHYSQGDVEITKKGSLKIGKVVMQRKGGTPDPTSLQFKINPLSLFEDL